MYSGDKTHFAYFGEVELTEAEVRQIRELGEALVQRGYVFRCGHCDALDASLAEGYLQSGGEMEVYVPVTCAPSKEPVRIVASMEAMQAVGDYFTQKEEAALLDRELLALKLHQLLGENLITRAKFIFIHAQSFDKYSDVLTRIAVEKGVKLVLISTGKSNKQILNSLDYALAVRS